MSEEIKMNIEKADYGTICLLYTSINGISTEDELQDTFLEFVEENNN